MADFPQDCFPSNFRFAMKIAYANCTSVDSNLDMPFAQQTDFAVRWNCIAQVNMFNISGGCCGSRQKKTRVGGWAWAWWLVTDVQRLSLEVNKRKCIHSK